MHTYRDAIPEAASAWVLYPGTARCHWTREELIEDGVTGVGAIPLVPGEPLAALQALVARLLGDAASPRAAASAALTPDRSAVGS